MITTLVFSMFASDFLMGQENHWDLWMNPATDDFATIRQNVENYFADKDKEAKGSGYKQWKRWEYIQQDRLTIDGKLMNYSAKNFQEYQDFAGQYGSRASQLLMANGNLSGLNISSTAMAGTRGLAG